MSEIADDQVQLLLFEAGGLVYGADATQVLRIDRARADAAALPGAAAGAGARALVVRDGGREALVRVDSIRGVVNAPVSSLRRIPPAARAHPAAIGFWLGSQSPILLVDLRETAKGSPEPK